jgi:hypothetical protein
VGEFLEKVFFHMDIHQVIDGKIQKHGNSDLTSDLAGWLNTWSRTCWSARTSGGEFGWMIVAMVDKQG